MPLALRRLLFSRFLLSSAAGLLAALAVGAAPAAAQTVPSSPAYYDPAGGDGTRGTADDDYRPTAGESDLIGAGQTGVGLSDALDIDGDGDTGEPIPGVFNTSEFTGESEATISYAPSSGDALPVEMAGFEARYRSASGGGGSGNGGGEVLLTWQTASETGNAGFVIERRVEESSEGWAQVGQVDGAGTATEPQSYRFVDAELPFEAGRLTYRLRQTDLDGSTSTFGPVAVERQAGRLALKAPRPNPAARRTQVPALVPDGAEGPATLSVYDVTGRQVLEQAIEGEGERHLLTLDVSSLASGTYLLRLQAGQEAHTRRLTVVR